MAKIVAVEEIRTQMQRLQNLKQILPTKAYENIATSVNEIIEETKHIFSIHEDDMMETLKIDGLHPNKVVSECVEMILKERDEREENERVKGFH